jgi:maltose alpha-D-glucosyltransferase/alpha-amylase
MVTDRERDSMYRIYATEPRARINVGIRRRLAPLMENDRRRIELLTGLLLSMPGTPIIYYGDELGMGDNIYLSDRDGVRTPMQWSIDRNGGFSRADPARLYLPPIMDPVYGFQSVNVESQSRSPSSLINWLRKLIAVRQGYKVFGRGTLTFLMPTNRKVIAYVREYEDEKILCVANLARTAQQVVLDLSPYKGRVPVEMSGWSPFHAIAADRYAVSLPGHGFYWFLLSDSARAPKWYADAPGQLPEMLTLVLPRDIDTTQLGGKALELFESDVLPAYLPKQRWYADKSAAVGHFALTDTARLEHDDVRAYLTMVEGTHRYFVPTVIGDDTDGERSELLGRATLARTRTGAHSGFLLDAFAVDGFARALLDDIRNNREVAGLRGGRYRATATANLGAVTLAAAPSVRRLDVEQSNTSVVVGERVILKGYRRVHPGPQPELEIARFLDAAGYRNTPALYGSLEYIDAAGESTALAIAQEFVESQGDGWTVTITYLERFFDRRKNMAVPFNSSVHPDGALADGTSHEPDYHEIFVQRARTLGVRTAEVHRAFASAHGDPAFEPEAVTESDLVAWSTQARDGAEVALASLEREIERVPSDLRPFAQTLLAMRDELYERLAPPPSAGLRDLVKTRYHGDYHLGQVLVVADDFKLVDFEGEPGRPLPERRRKSSPLRDVAGMLRSIDYASVAAMRGTATDRGENTSALAPLAREWERRAVDAFLSGYREAIAGCPSYPTDPVQAQRLLELFVLEKAFYEVSYELANRPAWVRIPLEGIRNILNLESPEPAVAG